MNHALGDLGVLLVDCQQNGQAAAAQQVGYLLVLRHHPGLAFDEKHRDRGFGDCETSLLPHFVAKGLVTLEVDASRIDDQEAAPVPLPHSLFAVTGDPRLRGDDCIARAGDAVVERRLAGVGVADDGHAWQSSCHSLSSL